jgi:hypothetical protein
MRGCFSATLIKRPLFSSFAAFGPVLGIPAFLLDGLKVGRDIVR